jgi:hypothetical protein
MCGFEVLSSAPCYHNGQYLKIEAQPAGLITGADRADSETLNRQTLAVERFGSLCRTVIDAWRDAMQSLTTKGLRVAVWGAGAAAVTFFNTFHLTGQIGCVVDINPRSHGHFIPGTDQQVKHPNFLKDYKPDVVVLTNATYEKEIRRNLSEFGLTSRVYSLANPAAARELQAAPAKNL